MQHPSRYITWICMSLFLLSAHSRCGRLLDSTARPQTPCGPRDAQPMVIPVSWESDLRDAYLARYNASTLASAVLLNVEAEGDQVVL